MFNVRYIAHLEAEIERLKAERDHANEERQGMLNSLLAHVGAPSIEVKQSVPVVIPQQRRRNVPSIFRAMREGLARKNESERITQ